MYIFAFYFAFIVTTTSIALDWATPTRLVLYMHILAAIVSGIVIVVFHVQRYKSRKSE